MSKAVHDTKRAAINLAVVSIIAVNQPSVDKGDLMPEQLAEAVRQRVKAMERMPLDNLLQRLLIELPASAYHAA